MKWLRRLFHPWRSPDRSLRRRADREVQRLFSERAHLLKGTSLRVEHRGRVQVLDAREDPWEIWFGIIRHPRPYAFSRQFHEVLEVWCYRVEEGRVTREKGVNLTRQRGEDGDPSSAGIGV